MNQTYLCLIDSFLCIVSAAEPSVVSKKNKKNKTKIAEDLQQHNIVWLSHINT